MRWICSEIARATSEALMPPDDGDDQPVDQVAVVPGRRRGWGPLVAVHVELDAVESNLDSATLAK
jgi:hypothetical protein